MNVRLRRPLDVILGRPQDVRSGRPWDGQIGSLGEVLGTLEGDVLGTSWGPIFAGWKYFTSSHLSCSVKKGVLRNFTKFTGKHLCRRFFFNKIAGQIKTLFLQNTSGRLLLLFPHKIAYSSNNLHDVYKNADGSSKFI